MRIILLILAVWIILFAVRRYLRNRPPRQQQAAVHTRMVRCEHCGIHIPHDEAIRDGEHNYCSVEHKESGPA